MKMKRILSLLLALVLVLSLGSFTALADPTDNEPVQTEPEYSGPVTYSWSEDASSCVASQDCTNANEFEPPIGPRTANAASITPSGKPDCTETVEITYTATFNVEWAETSSKTVSVAPTGHDWGEPSWTWADDFASASATFVCNNNNEHRQSENAILSKNEQDGVTVYTATVTIDGNTYTDTKSTSTPDPGDASPTPETIAPTDPTAPPAPLPTPTIEYEQGEVKGTGYVLVLTGPIETVTVKGWNANADAFFTLDKEGVITGVATPSRDKKDQVIQLQIPLEDGESVYNAVVTVRDTGTEKAQPIGISLYQFDENESILSMVYLRDALEVKPEDGEVRLDIDTAKEGQDALIVHSPDKSTGGEPLPTSAISGSDIGAPYIVKARVEVSEQAPETEQNSGTFRRHGEVAYFRAPEQEGYKFDGWYLEGQDEPLTTDPELYYFVTGSTVLIARYTADESASAGGPGDGKTNNKSGSGLLIGLIIGGTLALAGIVIAVLAFARKSRDPEKKYPLVREREETLVQAAPLTDMQASVDPKAMAKRKMAAPKAAARPRAANRAAGVEVHQGPMAGKTVAIKPDQTLTIGRSDTCDIVFPSNYLSRVHCEIRYDRETGMYMVKDLAANGTYFADRRRLPNGRELAVEPGTKLLLASNECTVTLK